MRATVVLATVVLGAGTLAAGLGGCGSGPATHRAVRDLHGAVDYWTRQRLLAARPWRGTPRVPAPVPSAHTASLAADRVGAVFAHSASGDHFCTASVVNSPVTCKNLTTRQSATQLRFDCAGFFGGTSGSPWVTGFDPVTRTGTIVGYQEGGDTDAVSCSSYFGSGIRQLYQRAEAES
jgi:hypothetical protein